MRRLFLSREKETDAKTWVIEVMGIKLANYISENSNSNVQKHILNGNLISSDFSKKSKNEFTTAHKTIINTTRFF